MTGSSLRCAVVLPGGTAAEQLEQALLAEQAGWDGVFAWEAAYGVEPWTLLGAIAARTTRIRVGTMLTPLPWRRPWKVASQVATLDQLSAGRAILAVGLGALGTDLPDTGEVTGLRERADLLDEGIDLIHALWAGERSYHGQHYQYQTGRLDLTAAVTPVQSPIPLWVVAAWPRPKSMRRVLRCSGLLPQFGGAASDGAADGDTGAADDGTPGDARAALAWLADHGAPEGLDLVIDGETLAADPAGAAAHVAPWAAAGCTWWLESRWGSNESLPQRLAAMTERIAAGPPRP